MKKTTLTTLFLLFVFGVYTQPSLTNSMNFTIGDTYKIDQYLDATGIDPGQSGANVSWDFSQISGTYTEGVNTICVDPSTTLFADSAGAFGSDICTRNADNPNLGAFSYYNCESGNEQYVAMGFLETGNSSFTRYLNPQTTLEYPFTYLGSFTDSWEIVSYHIDMGYEFMRDSAIVTVVADAWGTIETPYGTFTNALRVVRTTVDYFWYRYVPGGSWTFLGAFNDVEYEWYVPDIKVPVFSIFQETGTPIIVKYLADHNFTTDISSNNETTFSIYPVPASDEINIVTDQVSGLNSYSVFTLSGKLIDTGNIDNMKINVNSMSKGTYVLKICSSDKVISKKIIIN